MWQEFFQFLKSNSIEVRVILIVGIIVGGLAGYFLHDIIRKGTHYVVRRLDNVVLIFSLLVASMCIIAALIYDETEVSIQILSFYASFVFAWLLTKKSAKEEFERTQHKVAKNTYRHIEDVETAAIITRDRLQKCQEELTKSPNYRIDIEGLIDNIDVILTGVRSNKKDWEDMLRKSYRDKIREGEDPEAKLAHVRKKRETVNPPEKETIAKTFSEKGNQQEKAL